MKLDTLMILHDNSQQVILRNRIQREAHAMAS